ncbi:hypothetical protein BMT52_04110 [Escherichia coli]|uniref:Uncharacterized protein n=1 Tax=Escherichia coli TaxID=562 RepID=A0AAP7TVZ1_ECOLX|nr:hypothetical protein JD73_00615 [Escherichia coli]OKB73855.1 hypothetical protein BMT50_14185 [Escherichia coli]OKB81555.1 hypothetical protein BMT51_23885 [Escherichia coli]OKB84127.1 hypothetical protein BMT52_04110 [Escherichia coli]OKB89938.1 hypothetical protein BMT53_10615 [Escherichia coli]
MFTAVSIFQCIVGEMSVGDIKFTFIIILLLLCVFYKSAHVMISVDTMWLSVSLPGHAYLQNGI